MSKSRLTAPALTNPDDGATNVSSSPPLTWEKVHGISQYDLSIAKDASFEAEEIMLVEEELSERELETVTMGWSRVFPPHTSFYWRVRASRGDEQGPWSEARSFRTGKDYECHLSEIDPYDSLLEIQSEVDSIDSAQEKIAFINATIEDIQAKASYGIHLRSDGKQGDEIESASFVWDLEQIRVLLSRRLDREDGRVAPFEKSNGEVAGRNLDRFGSQKRGTTPWENAKRACALVTAIEQHSAEKVRLALLKSGSAKDLSSALADVFNLEAKHPLKKVASEVFPGMRFPSVSAWIETLMEWQEWLTIRMPDQIRSIEKYEIKVAHYYGIQVTLKT